MPVYVYKCTRCGFVTEEVQGIHDEPLTDCGCCFSSACASCQEDEVCPNEDKLIRGTLQRVPQPTGIQFIGRGFHVNDYRGR